MCYNDSSQNDVRRKLILKGRMKMIKEFEGIMPEIDESVFVAESADIIGDVKIGKNSSVWYNTVLRGDEHAIRIGENTNIQDGTVVHVGLDVDTVIGDNVTVGHNALVHGCKIGNNSLVGMGPMNIVFASGSFSFMRFAIVAIGDMLCDIFSCSSGKLLRI